MNPSGKTDLGGPTMVNGTAKAGKRRRLSLAELLVGATPTAMKRLNARTAWAREGRPIGREVVRS